MECGQARQVAVAQVTLERFRKIPLTTRLTEEQVMALLPVVEEVSLSKGDVLFQQGMPAPSVYFVEKGRVAEVERDRSGREIVVRYAVQGEYLGRYALVTGQPFRVSAVAEEDSTLLAIPLRYLQPLLFAHSDWRSWFFHTDIAARLRAVPLLIGFSDWDIYRLADAVEVQEYAAGSPVFRAGDEADSFYIVDRGQVMQTPSPRMQPQKDWPRYFATGNHFGDFSLQRGKKRQADAIARLPTRLFRIPGPTMVALLADRARQLPGDQARVDVLGRLQGVPLFATLDDQQLRLLSGYVCLEYHRSGDIVARQGEAATSLMILDEGEAVVRLQTGRGLPRPVAYMKAYGRRAAPVAEAGGAEVEYFGAHALLADEMRGATVEVTKPSVWIVLNRADFERFLADAGLRVEGLKQARQAEAQGGTPPPSSEDDLPLPYKVRRHWIVPVAHVLPLVVIMFLVVMLIVADVTSAMSHGAQSALMWLGIFGLGALALWALYRYVDWRNDTYEVTNEAVIHTEKKPFISEERYEIPLHQIQNVNIFVDILGRQLGYGNVAIDTAAAKGQIFFTIIPEPAYVQELIQRASAKARSGLQVQRRESIREQLEDQLHPERLKPFVPDSVQVQPEPEPQPPSSDRFARFRTLGGWLPRLEIRENGRVVWRKHWINLLQRTGIQALAMLLALYLLLAFALASATKSLGMESVELPPVSLFGFQGWLFFLLGVLSFFAILWFVYQYVDWRNDIYIVTDNEVIDVERDLAIFPFFFFYTESRRQASLANVQYVDLNVPGPLAMLLNYGNVIVQTAGAEGRLDFLFVGKPRRVHDEILRRLAVYQERQSEREFQERWGDMAQWFETYRDIQQQTGSQDG
jgi:CRP-like cAMP-binding protein/membrane protein YdbS with pleckstrin-like domain